MGFFRGLLICTLTLAAFCFFGMWRVYFRDLSEKQLQREQTLAGWVLALAAVLTCIALFAIFLSGSKR